MPAAWFPIKALHSKLLTFLLITWGNVESILVDDSLVQGIGQGHPEALGPSRVVGIVKVLNIENQLQPILESIFSSWNICRFCWNRQVLLDRPGQRANLGPFCISLISLLHSSA